MKRGAGNRGSSRWLLDLGVGRAYFKVGEERLLWERGRGWGEGERERESYRIYCWVTIWDECCM